MESDARELAIEGCQYDRKSTFARATLRDSLACWRREVPLRLNTTPGESTSSAENGDTATPRRRPPPSPQLRDSNKGSIPVHQKAS
jgi:hypothetical protein